MRFLASLIAFSLPVFAELSAEQKQLNVDSFEKVWTTIRDKHWEKNPSGLDWKAVHDELRPKIDKAQTMDDARSIMRDMLGRLKQTHFGIFPADVYKDVDEVAKGDGSTGIDLRVLNRQVVVTSIDPDSPAEKAGVKLGWAIESVDGKPLAPVIEKLKTDAAIHELQLTRVMLARLSGPVGGKLKVAFLDGANQTKTLELKMATPRGESSKFGNLPAMHVWFESRKIGNTGYISFNVFLNLVRVMSSFSDAVASCAKCDGLIIDLRGNPGGIGGMAMGMAASSSAPCTCAIAS